MIDERACIEKEKELAALFGWTDVRYRPEQNWNLIGFFTRADLYVPRWFRDLDTSIDLMLAHEIEICYMPGYVVATVGVGTFRSVDITAKYDDHFGEKRALMWAIGCAVIHKLEREKGKK